MCVCMPSARRFPTHAGWLPTCCMATHTPTFFAIVRDVILPNWLLIRPCLSHDNITHLSRKIRKNPQPRKTMWWPSPKIVKNNQPSSSSNLPVAPGWNRTPAGLLLLLQVDKTTTHYNRKPRRPVQIIPNWLNTDTHSHTHSNIPRGKKRWR